MRARKPATARLSGAAGQIVRSAAKEPARLTGETRPCGEHGDGETCTGREVGLLWPDGSRTWECSDYLEFNPATGEWRFR